MTTYFISRHAGAIAWARSQGYEPDHWIEHLDISVIKAGDTVTGTLPIPMARTGVGVTKLITSG